VYVQTAGEVEVAVKFLQKGVADRTRDRYTAECEKFWMTFLEGEQFAGKLHGVDIQRFASDITDKDVLRRLIVAFVIHLVDLQARGQKILHVLSAISFMFKSHMVDSSIFSDPTVRLARAAAADATGAWSESIKRMPFVHDMLLYAETILWDAGDIDQQMTFVGIILAFHFCLRVSEYVHSYIDDDGEVSHAIDADDIEFILRDGSRVRSWAAKDTGSLFEDIAHVKLVVRTSKCDKKGKGRILYISRRGVQETHLIMILFQWSCISGIKMDDPFLSRYKMSNHRLRRLKLTTKMVNESLKDIAEFFGFPRIYFSSHSLRIGGSTTMRAAGMNKEDVNRITGHHPDYDTDLIYQHITPIDVGGALALVDRVIENEVEIVGSTVVFQSEAEFCVANPSTRKSFVLNPQQVSLMLPTERTVPKGAQISKVPSVSICSSVALPNAIVPVLHRPVYSQEVSHVPLLAKKRSLPVLNVCALASAKRSAKHNTKDSLHSLALN